MKLKIKLTKEQFDKWLVELRSGEYIQSPVYLKLNTGGKITYCCLGVLCETLYPSFNECIHDSSVMNFYDDNGVIKNWSVSLSLPSILVESEIGFITNRSYNGFTNESGLLPFIENWTQEQKEKFSKVIKNTNMRPENNNYECVTLAGLNDSGLFDFKYIADLIEEFLEPSL